MQKRKEEQRVDVMIWTRGMNILGLHPIHKRLLLARRRRLVCQLNDCIRDGSRKETRLPVLGDL